MTGACPTYLDGHCDHNLPSGITKCCGCLQTLTPAPQPHEDCDDEPTPSPLQQRIANTTPEQQQAMADYLRAKYGIPTPPDTTT